MKKTISIALLATLVFTASLPAFAQGRKLERNSVKASRTQFARVGGITDGNGVLVQWDMTIERRNVGYFVYRVGGAGNERVRPAMVPGSAARSKDETVYGGRYQIFDPLGDATSQYIVVSIGVDGSEIASRLATVSVVKDLETATGASSAIWHETANTANRSLDGGEMELHSELRQIVNESLEAPDLTTHRWVVGQPGVKIAVRKEGMYRVTAGELAAAGFDTEADSAGWRLFAEGNEQAISVSPSAGFVEFYAKPIDTTESDTRVYYLINGTEPGRRIGTRILRSIGGTSVSTNYQVSTVKRERINFINTIHNGDAENYFGTLLSSSPATYNFDLSAVESAGDVTVSIKLQGYIGSAHSVRIVLNGQELPSMTWNGSGMSFTRSYVLPANRLFEGANTLEMTTLNPGQFDLFDSISVTYRRRYQAEQNKAGFFTPGLRKVDVTGFTSSNVRVFDTTIDGNPKQIVNLSVTPDGSNFKVTLPASRNFVGYAIEDSALLVSPSVTANNPSNYAASSTPYDLLIISHGSTQFMNASESWANYRRSQGFTAKVVDIADIYDEFNYGSASAESIKLFLNYAYTTWTQDPKYVLLIGDATHDPRNYEGFGNWDLVPSKNVDLTFEESVSDDALADFDSDGLAEIAIGRIPARDLAGISTAYAKTTSFESLANQSLDRGALFAYDLPNGWDFQATSQLLADQLPPTMPRDFVGRGSPTAQDDLINLMNNGKYIVNYAGHGSLSLWASSSFFSGSNVPMLTNGNNPSFFTMLTCLNGYFIKPSPNFDSISEHLLKSTTGGAAATWASTASTTPDIQQIMAIRFYGKLAEGRISRVGDLIQDAKTEVQTGDVRYSWVLLGDPMLKMR